MAELGTIGQGGVGWPWPEVGPSDDTSLSEHSSRISNTMFRSLHPYFGVLLFPVYPAACAAGCSLLTTTAQNARLMMWWLLAFAQAHPSPHGILSKKYVSTHALGGGSACVRLAGALRA